MKRLMFAALFFCHACEAGPADPRPGSEGQPPKDAEVAAADTLRFPSSDGPGNVQSDAPLLPPADGQPPVEPAPPDAGTGFDVVPSVSCGPPGTPCDDGQPCTYDDKCDVWGECHGKGPITCTNDPGPCGAKRACDGTAKCAATFPKANACNDNNPCTQVDACNGAGKCVGAPSPKTAVCSDNNLCTENDRCDGAGKCVGQLVHGWQQKVEIYKVQADPDGHWSTLQHKTWTVDRPIRRVRLRGSSDDGGYCHAYWGSGYAAIYRHAGQLGLYNADDQWYSFNLNGTQFCPAKTPTFDAKGTALLCQFTTDAGPMTLGKPVASFAPMKVGTTIHVKARHTIGKSTDLIHCMMDVACD